MILKKTFSMANTNPRVLKVDRKGLLDFSVMKVTVSPKEFGVIWKRFSYLAQIDRFEL